MRIVWKPRNIIAVVFLAIFGCPFITLSIIFEKLSDWCELIFDVFMDVAEIISGRK